MGYDETDCYTAATVGLTKTFPYTVHGRTYQNQEEYDAAIADFLNGF